LGESYSGIRALADFIRDVTKYQQPSNRANVELRVGVERHVCFAYIVKSKVRSKKKRVIQPGVCVWNIFLVDSG